MMKATRQMIDDYNRMSENLEDMGMEITTLTNKLHIFLSEERHNQLHRLAEEFFAESKRMRDRSLGLELSAHGIVHRPSGQLTEKQAACL
jgi:hypothetical protein